MYVYKLNYSTEQSLSDLVEDLSEKWIELDFSKTRLFHDLLNAIVNPDSFGAVITRDGEPNPNVRVVRLARSTLCSQLAPFRNVPHSTR